MNAYTILDYFNDEGGSLWVANYNDKDDAKKCFLQLLDCYNMVDENGFVKFVDGDEEYWADDKVQPLELFDCLIDHGLHYNYNNEKGLTGKLFVRGEEMQKSFNENKMPY